MADIPSWIGARLGDRVGRRVGTVRDVYYDQATSRPAWLLVTLADERLVLVPADGALSWHEAVVVPHDDEVISTAPVLARVPDVVAGEPLLRLARHYGVRVDRSAGYAAVHGAARLSQAA
jgi:hypothetical protein